VNKLDRRFFSWFFEFTAVVVFATVAGIALENRFHTPQQLILSCLLIGALAMEGWNLYKIIKQASNK